MKKVLAIGLVALMMVSLCACKTTKDTEEVTGTPTPTTTPTPAIKAEQVNDPYGEDKQNDGNAETGNPTEAPKDTTPTATPAPTVAPVPTTPPTPTSMPKDDKAFSKMNVNVRVVSSADNEIKSLDEDELEEMYYDLDVCLHTFPSTNRLEADSAVAVASVTELMDYINVNNNLWNTDEDVWIFEKEKFEHHHDFFYNTTWKGKKDIHYFIVEATTMLPQCAFIIDEDKMYYDNETRTLYLELKKDFNYKMYISQLDTELGERVETQAVSNRGILALNYRGDYEIEEIVIIKPKSLY